MQDSSCLLAVLGLQGIVKANSVKVFYERINTQIAPTEVQTMRIKMVYCIIGCFFCCCIIIATLKRTVPVERPM